MYKRDEFINLQSLYLAHKHSIYSLINPSFPRWIFLICEARKNSEARVGPVSSSERLVLWICALLLTNATYRHRPRSSSAHAHDGTRTRVHAAAYTTQEGRSLSSVASSVRWREAYYVDLLARSPVATERSRSAHCGASIAGRFKSVSSLSRTSSNFLRGNSRYILIFITRCLFK